MPAPPAVREATRECCDPRSVRTSADASGERRNHHWMECTSLQVAPCESTRLQDCNLICLLCLASTSQVLKHRGVDHSPRCLHRQDADTPALRSTPRACPRTACERRAARTRAGTGRRRGPACPTSSPGSRSERAVARSASDRPPQIDVRLWGFTEHLHVSAGAA